MRIALAIVVGACGASESSSTGPREPERVRVVGCRAATPAPLIEEEGAIYGTLTGEAVGEEGGVEGPAPEPPPAPTLTAAPWTPFAISPIDSMTPTVARAAEASLRARLPALDACFGANAATGSLRAMLELSPSGELTGARIGGLGDHAIETCVRNALVGLRVVMPSSEFVELACDLSRGDARPWRVTPEGGYAVLAATRTGVSFGGTTIIPGATEPEPLPARDATLVIVEPEAPGTIVELALAWATDSDAIVLGLRAPAGPPTFLGLGRTASSATDGPSVDAIDVTLKVSDRLVTACIQSSVSQAKLSEPASVGALVNRIAARCGTSGCTSTIAVALDGAAEARDLVEVLGTLRRAGIERVLIGGSAGCHAGPSRPGRSR